MPHTTQGQAKSVSSVTERSPTTMKQCHRVQQKFHSSLVKNIDVLANLKIARQCIDLDYCVWFSRHTMFFRVRYTYLAFKSSKTGYNLNVYSWIHSTGELLADGPTQKGVRKFPDIW